MSLGIYLKQENTHNPVSEIYIREDGQNKQISLAEWEKRFPDKTPYIVTNPDTDFVYHANITHNLGKMAEHANLYMYLWRPEELGLIYAKELITPLEEGLVFLNNNKEYLEQFNPENGWGNYNILLKFVIEYLEYCKLFPNAKIEVSR